MSDKQKYPIGQHVVNTRLSARDKPGLVVYGTPGGGRAAANQLKYARLTKRMDKAQIILVDAIFSSEDKQRIRKHPLYRNQPIIGVLDVTECDADKAALEAHEVILPWTAEEGPCMPLSETFEEDVQEERDTHVLQQFGHLLQEVSKIASARARAKGFWDDRDVVRKVPEFQKNDRGTLFVVSEALALIHSEASEGLEAVRAGGMEQSDDKIPAYRALDAELADVIIRICDLNGGLGLDVGSALAAKMTMNKGRAKMHGKSM